MEETKNYQNQLEAKEYAETVAVLRERIKSLREGAKGVPMEEVFQSLAKEHGFSLEEE